MPDMTASELAQLMLQWEQKRRELDVIEHRIRAAVLTLGKTQTVGNVRATYSKGRTTYDYEGTLRQNARLWEAAQFTLRDYTKQVVDWKGVCEEMGVEDVRVLQHGTPSVSLKLLT